MNTMPSPTTTNTLQPEAPSSSPEVPLKNKSSTTAGMMMDQTPKHRNTSTNALSKLDYSEDYGGVNNLTEGDLRPRGSTAINSGAMNNAAINNSNNGARRFPGMRTAAPPPDYNTTTSRLRPPPPHHPSTAAAAYHHHPTAHREYGRTYEGSYDDYIHDLSAPLPDYDVPPSYSLFGRDPHRAPHHRELPREHRMPRERIVDYHSGGGRPPPPHHYYRPPPPQYYDYYDGYYRDHDYRPSVSGGEVNGGGGGEGR
eukprot:scaffold7161_cov103-Skeletonema_dohrnii-CCMP3373.AAC.1